MSDPSLFEGAEAVQAAAQKAVDRADPAIRLAQVEQALTDLAQRIPMLAREVRAIRTALAKPTGNDGERA